MTADERLWRPTGGEEDHAQMGTEKAHPTAAEITAVSQELVRTSRLLINSVLNTIAESKRLCRQQVQAGLFKPEGDDQVRLRRSPKATAATAGVALTAVSPEMTETM